MTVSRQDFEDAIASYWGAKRTQGELSAIKNAIGAGTAGTVRGGSTSNTLVAAFELKALGAPSFGNNYNNRVEEALGSAVDLQRAALADLYPGEKPWLGYFFIMEDHKKSRSPVKPKKGVFPVEPIWKDASYQRRFSIFCERLMMEGLYDAVCYVASSPEDPKPIELVKSLDWQHFSAAITARITYLRELGFPRSEDVPTL